MANYSCASRTNYFKVTDIDKLKELVESVNAELFEGENNTFGFGNYDNILMGFDDEDGESFEIVNELQKILPEGEVIIAKEIGNEKLRYLTAYAILITNKEVVSIELDDFIQAQARQLIGDKNYTPKLIY